MSLLYIDFQLTIIKKAYAIFGITPNPVASNIKVKGT